MLLSDRDIRSEVADGNLAIDPFDPSLVQPSSVDVRLDNLFRVFNNTRYTHIDPAQRQDELTSLVEPADGEPFVLHPGEFVLGSTFEAVTLSDAEAGTYRRLWLRDGRLVGAVLYGTTSVLPRSASKMPSKASAPKS